MGDNPTVDCDSPERKQEVVGFICGNRFAIGVIPFALTALAKYRAQAYRYRDLGNSGESEILDGESSTTIFHASYNGLTVYDHRFVAVCMRGLVVSVLT